MSDSPNTRMYIKEQFGIEPLPGESDEALHARVISMVRAISSPGTIAAADFYFETLVMPQMPAVISVERVKRALAVYWLRGERPTTFFARLAWVWKLARALFVR
jgi:hypothetical protein